MELAIDGGTPVRTKPFPAWPQFDVHEEKALLRSLRQGQWWRMHGSENGFFENEFAEHHGAQHAVTVASGTIALELALQAAGIGPGHEVIVPAFTFVSTSMACQRIGATPIPVDVLPDTYCIDPQKISAAIGPNTRAIIPVHMSGHFCDMVAIDELARKHGLIVIQDAAHAHGARGPGGKGVGEFGSMACFSFQNFKLMTAGEGGLVLCPDKAIRDKVFLYSNCGRPAGDRAYMHTVLGTNGRMGEFSAAVLRAQLGRLDAQTAIRERNAARLKDELKGEAQIVLQGRSDDAVVHPHYMFMFTLRGSSEGLPPLDRNYVVDCLIAEGVPAFRAYQALYRIPGFWLQPAPKRYEADFIRDCPVTENIAKNGIWIHHRALLGDASDTYDLAQAIKKVLSVLTRS